MFREKVFREKVFRDVNAFQDIERGLEAGLDGEVKIGIIDSGVAVDFLRHHPAIQVVEGASFRLDRERRILERTVYDRGDILAWRRGETALELEDRVPGGESDGSPGLRTGHGTVILSIVWRAIERARIAGRSPMFALARALDSASDGMARGEGLCLVGALEWMVEEVRPTILGLSLGTAHAGLRPSMERVVAEARRLGIRIFSAPGREPTLPSELADVIAVADRELASRPDLKIDRTVVDETVEAWFGGRWCHLPMTASYACALAIGEAAIASLGELSKSEIGKEQKTLPTGEA